jgi:hypothetical protein
MAVPDFNIPESKVLIIVTGAVSKSWNDRIILIGYRGHNGYEKVG